MREVLDDIADTVWGRIEKAEARGRTVTLKLRYADFRTITRARSLPQWTDKKAEFTGLGHALLEELLPLEQPVRLMGLTLSALEQDEGDAPEASDGQLSLL